MYVDCMGLSLLVGLDLQCGKSVNLQNKTKESKLTCSHHDVSVTMLVCLQPVRSVDSVSVMAYP